MPGFDGTGPRGIGPMTGQGRGFCALRAPDEADDAVTGIAGLAHQPVRLRAESRSADLASLRVHVRRVGMMIERLRRRVVAWDASIVGSNGYR
jgi:hypothetical protein